MSIFPKIIKLVNSTSMFYAQQYNNLILCSYHYVNPEIYYKHPEAKEIRGIVFDAKGNIVLRPFPKFFNYGEPACKVSRDDIATANEKLDGSLVSTGIYKDSIVIASKGSLKSWVVEKAKPIVYSHNYANLISDFKGYTVMFELLDPENPIVIQPTQLQLVLIGIRHNKSGKIISPIELEEIGKQYSLPYAKVAYKDITISQLKAIIKPLRNIEGIVAYTDKELCKIKTDWYLSLHKFTNLNEKKILKMYINNELDDLYGLLPNSVKDKVQNVIKKAEKRINNCINNVRRFFETHEFSSRKELAMFLQRSDIDKSQWKIYFDVYAGTPITEAVYTYFKKQWNR